MPLLFPSTDYTPATALAAIPPTTSPTSPHYLIFFASPDSSGRSWCPDCRNVEETISKLIPESKSTLIYVGGRPEWRDLNNAFRKEFGISHVPTIVRIESGDKSSLDGNDISKAPRLVEGEIFSKLQKFVS